MAFSWPRFLSQHHVSFVETGPNQNARQIGIRCPFCGSADPSEHMSLSRTTSHWKCRRNNSHSGASPVRLVAALLGISTAAAIRLVGSDAPLLPTEADFADKVFSALRPKVKATPEELAPLRFFPEMRPLLNQGQGRVAFGYLTGPDRLYSAKEAGNLCEFYGLRYASEGKYGGRVIIPLHDSNGRLVSWTGRAISKRAEIRYLTLSSDHFAEGKALPYFAPIHELVLNQQSLETEVLATLVVGEGPFDGLRLDYYGFAYGVRGTCLFGKSMSSHQEHLLIRIGKRYRRRVLLLDADASMDLLAMQMRLDRYGWEFQFMTGGKDPGGMPKPDLLELLERLGDKKVALEC